MIENGARVYNGNNVYNFGAGGGGGGVEILGNLYKTKEVGNFNITLNCFWSTINSGNRVKGGSSTQWYRGQEVTSLSNALSGSGWHVPSEAELQSLVQYCNLNGLHISDLLDLPLYHYDNNGNYTNAWPAITGVPNNTYSPLIAYYDGSNKINLFQTNTNFNQYWLVRLFED